MVHSSALGGHEELTAWFRLVAEWRKRTGGKMADELSGYEVGIMRCFDHKNPEGTKIAKLLRSGLKSIVRIVPYFLGLMEEFRHYL